MGFQCGGALSSAFLLASKLLGLLPPHTAKKYAAQRTRLVQAASIFGSFEYQMKGEAWLDGSKWPIRWHETVDVALETVDYLQTMLRGLPAREYKRPFEVKLEAKEADDKRQIQEMQQRQSGMPFGPSANSVLEENPVLRQLLHEANRVKAEKDAGRPDEPFELTPTGELVTLGPGSGSASGLALLEKGKNHPNATWMAKRMDNTPVADHPQKILVVSVCDYDQKQTPLEVLSRWNKKRYCDRHGYDLKIYSKSPFLDDGFGETLFQEPREHRPPAWGKVDGVIEGIMANQYDWVMWMDCDSYFTDQSLRIEDLLLQAQTGEREGDAEIFTPQDPQLFQEVQELVGQLEAQSASKEIIRKTVREFQDRKQSLQLGKLLDQWKQAKKVTEGLTQDHFDNMLSEGVAATFGVEDPEIWAQGRRLGWESWLLEPEYEIEYTDSTNKPLQWKRKIQLVASEDGLMLNTGIFFVRGRDPWGFRFFQKVRRLTFGDRAPVTQHSWWEQTAMVYLLQFPFHGMTHAPWRRKEDGLFLGVAPGLCLVDQRHVNGYPYSVGAALKTHLAWENGDYIVSFSGCKIFHTQEMCNAMFLSHFHRSMGGDTGGYKDIDDPVLQGWIEKGRRLYR